MKRAISGWKVERKQGSAYLTAVCSWTKCPRPLQARVNLDNKTIFLEAGARYPGDRVHLSAEHIMSAFGAVRPENMNRYSIHLLGFETLSRGSTVEAVQQLAAAAPDAAIIAHTSGVGSKERTTVSRELRTLRANGVRLNFAFNFISPVQIVRENFDEAMMSPEECGRWLAGVARDSQTATRFVPIVTLAAGAGYFAWSRSWIEQVEALIGSRPLFRIEPRPSDARCTRTTLRRGIEAAKLSLAQLGIPPAVWDPYVLLGD